MSTLLKILLPLAVLLPLGGFIAGSLATIADDEPPARAPIVLRDDETSAPTTPTAPSRAPSERPTEGRGDSDNTDDGDRREDDGEDHEPVVTPGPVENDDDHEDDDGDDRDDADEDNGDDGDDDDD